MLTRLLCKSLRKAANHSPATRLVLSSTPDLARTRKYAYLPALASRNFFRKRVIIANDAKWGANRFDVIELNTLQQIPQNYTRSKSHRAFATSFGLRQPLEASGERHYFETVIDWPSAPNQKLVFRPTTAALSSYTEARTINKFKLSDSEIRDAPFFNRKNILTALLNANLDNVALPAKPTYSVQAMGRGQGKSRLLIEWLPHAFAKLLTTEQATEIHQDGQYKKRLLNLLYYSQYRQYTILCTGSSLEIQPEGVAVQHLVSKAICELFSGQTVQYEGRDIMVNAESKATWFGLIPKIGFVPDVLDLLGLFIAICNQKFEAPPHLPYPDEGLPLNAKGYVFFSIDESQFFSAKGLSTEVDMVYQLFEAAANANLGCHEGGIYPFWYATGTWTKGKMIDLHLKNSRFMLIEATLDNLLDLRFLAKLCVQFYKANLHPDFVGIENNGMPEIPKDLSLCLVRNFLHTFGIPRAIETFVGSTYQIVPDNHFKYNNCYSDTDDSQLAALKQTIPRIDNFIATNLQKAVFGQSSGYEFNENNTELLNIKAAMCVKLDPENNIFENTPSTPKELVATGELLIWDRKGNHFFYTKPFYNITQDQLSLPVKCLNSLARDDPYWWPVHPTLATLIVDPRFAGFLYNNTKYEGASFEAAVAASLYTRYKIRAMDGLPVTFADLWASPPVLPSNWELDPKNFLAALMKSTVVLNGIVKLKHKQKTHAPDLQNELARNKLIAIDVSNSSSADVLIPVNVKRKVILVGFQCKQLQSIPDKKDLIKNAKRFFTIPRCQVWFGIAPKNCAPTDFEQLNSATQLALPVESDMLVSPLYQVGMSMVPASFKFDEKLEEPKKKKAKNQAGQGTHEEGQ